MAVDLGQYVESVLDTGELEPEGPRMPQAFKQYFSELRWLALFALPCRMLDALATKDARIAELEAELKSRSDHFNTEIENLRKEFIDREIARAGYKPIYQKPTPPPRASEPPQTSQASLIDQARQRLVGDLQATRTPASRAEDFRESLRKIQENGTAESEVRSA